jgi:hypothetical protein
MAVSPGTSDSAAVLPYLAERGRKIMWLSVWTTREQGAAMLYADVGSQVAAGALLGRVAPDEQQADAEEVDVARRRPNVTA